MPIHTKSSNRPSEVRPARHRSPAARLLARLPGIAWWADAALRIEHATGQGVGALSPAGKSAIEAGLIDEPAAGILRTGQPVHFEVRLEGRTHWGYAEPCGSGKNRSGGGYQGVAIDTSASTGEAPRAAAGAFDQASLRQALESSIQVGLAAVDLEGRQSYVNDAFCRMLGWNREELVGATAPFVYWSPEDLPAIGQAFEATVAGLAPPGGFELRLQRRNGERFNALAQISPLAGRSGELTGWLGSVTDISERKRMEHRLSAQLAVSRVLTESETLNDIAARILEPLGDSLGWDFGSFWVPDPERGVLRCLETWLRPGVEAASFEAETRGQTFARGDGMPGSVWAGKAPVWVRDAATDEEFFRAEAAARSGFHGAFGFPIILAGEVAAVLEYFSCKPRDPDPQLIEMFISTGLQIGQFLERKRLEEQVRQTQRLETIGVLAGGVAHDFNNLLTGILGNASIALETTPESSSGHAALRDVILASERAAGLTRQMLAYAGKGRFILQPVDLSEVVREIILLLRVALPKNVQLSLELSDRLPAVESDPGQIHQLIMNLVVNGAEALGEQQGSVTVSTSVMKVETGVPAQPGSVETLPPGAYVCLEVRDSGAGMDAAIMDRIFDPFFTTKFTGRGLGLAATQGIVRSHKGGIQVISVPGRGSTFRVLLPAAGDLAPTVEPPPFSASGTGIILVVDDEDIVRRTAKLMLERSGYTVLLANNGMEAVELFEKHAGSIGAVLLDLTMPVMGGEEALRRLQAIRADARVILSSGFDESEATRRFHGKGLSGFIQKPYRSAQLAEKVRTALTGGSEPAPN